MRSPGTFSVSLDFELHWGCIQAMKTMTPEAQKYFLNTRAAIPKMLSIFEEGEIHVTWAIVGMLFRKNKQEWEQNQPVILPTFNNPSVSAYEWVKKNGFINDIGSECYRKK